MGVAHRAKRHNSTMLHLLPSRAREGSPPKLTPR